MSLRGLWRDLDLLFLRGGRCLFLLMLLAIPLSATTYYVDCNGSDPNNGTSTTAAWRTIAKVNGSSFSPGDTVLLKAGCKWREELIVSSSGATGNPITFSAYGSGPSPVISGANLLTNWTTVAGLYCGSVTTPPNQVFVDGNRLLSVTGRSSLVTGSWWWDSANSRVCAYDNPSGHTVEASQRDHAIYAGNKSYLTVSNLEADAANKYGTFCNSCIGFLATHLTVSNNADTGLRVDSNTGAVVSYSTAAYNGGNGFTGYASPGLLFDHLTAHHNSWDITKTDTAGINLTEASTGYWPGIEKIASNVVVQNSESYDNGVAVCCSHGLGIWADTIGDGFVVRYNYVHDNNGIGIYAEKDSRISIHHNIVANNKAVSGDVRGGIVLYMDCAAVGCNMKDSVVANNVVYGNYGHGIRMLAQSINNDCTNNQVSNNISMNNSGDQLDAEFGCENVAYGSGNVYTFNALGTAAANFVQWGHGNTYSTYSSWEAATGNCGSAGCTHSLQSDPLFKNAAGNDFTLQNTSPAVNAGTVLGPGYSDGLDPRSTFPWTTVSPNNQRSGIDIGAFIFLLDDRPAAPTSLSATIK